MADDTRETPLDTALMDFWAKEAQRGVTQADLDIVIAAVRAECEAASDDRAHKLRGLVDEERKNHCYAHASGVCVALQRLAVIDAERDEFWRQQRAIADRGGHLPGSDF